MKLQEKALKANGLSRACEKCKLGRGRCTMEIAEVCRDAFVEGYKKGYTKRGKEQKEEIDAILHPANVDVTGEPLYIFFRDVRGREKDAIVEFSKFIKPKGIRIGEVHFKPSEEGAPQQLPIAWVKVKDLLKLLGYNKKFKELERISLELGWCAYPRKKYYENLSKYGNLKIGGK